MSGASGRSHLAARKPSGSRIAAASPTAKIMHMPAARVDHVVTPERARWRYFTRRCWNEGRSKATVVDHVGARAGLASERTYVSRTLPQGVWRELGLAVRGDLWGAVRATAIVAGLSTTAAGYLYGKARRHNGSSSEDGGVHSKDAHANRFRFFSTTASVRRTTIGLPSRPSSSANTCGSSRRVAERR